MHGSIPRLVDGVHIVHPNVDQMIQSRVVERHVVGAMIQLVLMESNEASMVNQVVYRQPLLQNVTEVFLRVFQPEQGGIDDL